jgi:hypothetical protein
VSTTNNFQFSIQIPAQKVRQKSGGRKKHRRCFMRFKEENKVANYYIPFCHSQQKVNRTTNCFSEKIVGSLLSDY